MSLQSEYYESLTHHGVKGMKWGVRKYQNEDGTLTAAGRKRYGDSSGNFTDKGKARFEYDKAQGEQNKAYKAQRKANKKAYGIEGLKKYASAERDKIKADVERTKAEAEYRKISAKNEKKAEKAEFKTYAKSVWRSGLEGSYNDRLSGGRSTALLNDIRTRKGEEYAHRVEKSVQNKSIALLATTAAVSLGSAVVAGLLSTRG